MTVWTCNILLKHHAGGDYRPRLWGDNDCELLAVLYGVGASLDDLATQRPDGEEFYLITPEQQLRAVEEFGAVPTDYLEPQAQSAERAGNWAKVAAIETTRENWRKGKLALPPPVPLLRDPYLRRHA